MFNQLTHWKRKSGDDKAHRDAHPLARLRHEFDELIQRFMEGENGSNLNWMGSQRLGSRIEWDDKEEEYILRAELPGFESSDIDVQVSGNVLTMRASHSDEQEKGEGNGGYRRFESFYETFTLPQGVIAEKIDARYHSGVLEVHLPKSEECQAKRIEVKTP